MKKIILLPCLGIVLFTNILGLNAQSIRANVTKVVAHGSNNSYSFAVTLKSDETGCKQYADWWEIVSADGDLLYRRILMHSHPDTQPFTRSGSRVNISSERIVYIRAHMNKLGYVGDVYKGSVQSGFVKNKTMANFAKNLDTLSPLPSACLY